MSTNQGFQTDNIKAEAKKVARNTTESPFVEALERLGYVARGVVYAVIGILALQVILGKGGKLTDPMGAISTIGNTPLGGIVLYVILVGLAGYGLWGLVRAFADPLHKGSDASGIVKRIGFAVSGISYLLLGVDTYQIIQGAGKGSQTTQLQQAAGTLLTKSWGIYVVAFVGLVIIVAGLLQVNEGFHPSFDKQFKVYQLTGSQQKWITRMGRFGMAARGLIFTLVGIFLFLAALQNNPAQAKGFDAVLATILQQPYGPLLLGVVAVGLIGFGIYSAMSGFWLRLKR